MAAVAIWGAATVLYAIFWCWYVGFRSRRDLLEVLPATLGSEHHGLKLAALEKTFAFPASPWFMPGGPRVVVALAVALIIIFVG